MSEKTVEVRGSPTRCPYCHDEVASADDIVACRECVARHHAQCWNQHGACSTCGARERLSPAARARLSVAQARDLLASNGFPREEIDAVLAAPGAKVGGASRRATIALTALAIAPIVCYSWLLGGDNLSMEVGYSSAPPFS